MQMGGRGNAQEFIDIVDNVVQDGRWRSYFNGFTFPYGFFGVREYAPWLREAGLRPTRLEEIRKTMKQKGKAGLAGWIRTTWLPYTERIPESLRESFISEVADAYIEAFPMDAEGSVRVDMVRLEVGAVKEPMDS
jgi:trans-aconitate methyltransferase